MTSTGLHARNLNPNPNHNAKTNAFFDEKIGAIRKVMFSQYMSHQDIVLTDRPQGAKEN